MNAALPPVPPRPRWGGVRFPLLLLVLAAASCTLRDPAGTSWTTVATIAAQPETLHVARALNNAHAALGEDSLLLFRQELDTSWARFGDSLLWRGTRHTMEWELGLLELDGLGDAAAVLPFSAAWPQYAGLVGTSARITGEAECAAELPLPVWPGVDWIAYADGSFALNVEHAWPFALAWLELDLLNAAGASLGHLRIEPAGGLPAGQARQDQLPLAGRLTALCRLRVRARHLAMPAHALIQDGTLDIALSQSAGRADSARVVPPPLSFAWSDSLPADPRLRMTSARLADLELAGGARNGTALPLDLALALPQARREPGGDAAGLELSLAAGAWVPWSAATGPLRVEEPGGLRHLRVAGTAAAPGGGAMATLRAGDRVEVELGWEDTPLETFAGWFSQDLVVPVLPRETAVDAWPPELAELELDGLELQLTLDNDVDAELGSLLLLGAESGHPGRPDTTWILAPDIRPRDSLVVVPDMGALPARLPARLAVSGHYRLPAGRQVELTRASRVGITAAAMPGRARVRRLLWRGRPESHADRVPEEAVRVRLTGEVENRSPLGGSLRGRVAAGPGEPAVALFEFDVPAGSWAQGGVTPALVPVAVELDDAAVAVMQVAPWILWYEFEAEDSGGEVELRAGQWVAVRTLIRADLELTVEGP